jgi:hypothetical protein
MRKLAALCFATLALTACAGPSLPKQDDLVTWQRLPLAPDQRLTDAALRSTVCRSGQKDDAPIQLLLQDRRTATSAAFLVSGVGFSGSCTIALNGGASGGSSREQPLDPLSGPIAVDERSTGGLGGGTASLVGGRVAPVVARVRIDLADGRVVDASVGNGHWLAWWPGDFAAVRIRALDLASSIMATLDDSTPGWQQK